ncbi:MAG TPA: ATP-binding protein [Anaerolineae bacterium]|nr:ATP-binding protein [Anaerolineae bacterium]
MFDFRKGRQLHSRLLWTTLPLALMGILVATGLTYYLSRTALVDLAEKWLATQLDSALIVAQENEILLREYGLGGIETSVAAAHEDTIAAFRQVDLGMQGFIFVVTGEGYIVEHPQPEMIGRRIDNLEWFRIIRGVERGRLLYLWEGETHLAVFAYFEPWDWYILATDPVNDVYGPIAQTAGYIALVALGVAILLSVGVVGVTRRALEPLALLMEGAQQLGSGQLNYKIGISPEHAELYDLAVTFNEMGRKLEQTLSGLEREVAERLQMEATLRRREQLFRLIFEEAPTGMALVGLDDRVLQANDAFAQSLEYELYQVVNIRLLDLLLPEDFPRYQEMRWQLLVDNRPQVTHHTHYRKKSGAVMTALVSAALVYDDERNPLHFVMQFVDVTARRQAEDAMHRAQKLESVGVLASGIAHDFNNLLASLATQLSVIQFKVEEKHPALSNLKQAMISVERATDLTKQLLVYAGKGEVKRVPMGLNELLEENISLLTATIPSTVTLDVDLADDLPLIEADRGQMQQVVMNLVINAAQAMRDQRGKVWIKTAVYQITDNSKLSLCVDGTRLLPGEYIEFLVKDEGVGMDKDTITRIFDPFFTTKATGHGLGLSSLLGIVRAHGGGVRLESRLGEGSSFCIYLPVAPLAVQLLHSLTVSPVTAQGVLVIDQEQLSREIVADWLRMQGWKVCVSQTGEDGLAYCDAHDAMLHSAYVGLPLLDMSGQELVENLQKRQAGFRLLVSATEEARDEAYRLQQAYPKQIKVLIKPFTLVSLRDKMGWLFRRD